MQKNYNGDRQLELSSRVLAAYDTARDRGLSRFDAFCRAVMLYRSERPSLPINLAGSEVARLLAAAARGELMGNAGNTGLANTADAEYANVT